MLDAQTDASRQPGERILSEYQYDHIDPNSTEKSGNCSSDKGILPIGELIRKTFGNDLFIEDNESEEMDTDKTGTKRSQDSFKSPRKTAKTNFPESPPKTIRTKNKFQNLPELSLNDNTVPETPLNLNNNTGKKSKLQTFKIFYHHTPPRRSNKIT